MNSLLNIVDSEEEDTLTTEGQYLTFWIDSQLFGVNIADVVQIIGIQNITPIPDAPAYAKGVIDLRGSIIPVIDVRMRFGRPWHDARSPGVARRQHPMQPQQRVARRRDHGRQARETLERRHHALLDAAASRLLDAGKTRCYVP